MTKRLETLKNRGMNIGSGLYYCNGNEDLYYELLDAVIEESVEKKKLINKAVEEGNFKGYYLEVHALKNVTAIIGADDFNNILTDLCAVIKISQNLPNPEKVSDIMTKYDSLVKIIAESK